MSAGNTPKGRSQSLFAVCTQATNATGNPQKRAERPRTNRPRELSNSGFGPASPDSSGLASDGEVGVFLESTFIVIKQSHAFRRLELVRFDRLVDLCLHLALQFQFIVLHGSERLDDSGAFDDFLDVITGAFVGIQKNMDLIHAAKKVVQIAHDVLVGAHEEKSKVVWFLHLTVVVQSMQR